ncbi:YfhO family protein [Carnobacterium sp.]|uniref:YfhO family protein n=1 Tax=Carnobacterium sp. TaxID=48221 RepID=UPI0028AEB11C|nr:YfhO family protein [Carnobacterium sp.]
MGFINKKKHSTKKVFIIITLFMILSVISVYFTHLYHGEIIVGDDFQFHKNRIEGLYEALKIHNFFPKINMVFMNSMGYASSIFYSDFFLYFPALLRLLGFSLAESYIAFVIVINFVTFIIAFASHFLVIKDQRKSLIFSLLYTLSSYRLLDLTTRAALGEVLAICFLPLAFMGLYQIIYGNSKKWYYLTLGMALIIHAHILSAVMFSLLIVLFLVVNVKRMFFEKERLISIVKAAFLTVPLIVSYLFPVLEQLASQTFKVSSNPIFFMSEKASQLGNAFLNALSNKSTPNIGITLLLLTIFYVLSMKKIKAKTIFCMGLLLLGLTTDLFPWKILDHTFLNTIQFPWRFLAFATLLLSWVIGEDPLNLFENKKVFYTLSILITVFTLSYTLNLRSQVEAEKIVSYGEYNQINSYKIGAGKEYLPDKANFEDLMNKKEELIYDSSKLTIKNYHKNKDVIIFDYQALSKELVTVPLIYYKGYVGELSGKGTISEPFLNEAEAGLTSVAVEGTGTVKIYYKDTLIQKLSQWVSIASWILLLSYLFVIKRRQIREDKR